MKLPAGNDSLPCKYGGSGTGLLSRRYGTIENKTTMVSFTMLPVCHSTNDVQNLFECHIGI